MRTVTSDWATTLGASHSIKNTISVWEDGVRKSDVPFTEANVILDMDSEFYGALTVKVADEDMLASDNSALLLPYGQRLRVECGLNTPAGLETVTIDCDFLIVETPTSSGWMSEREVTATTTIEMVKDARFLNPYQPTKGSAVKTLLTFLLDDAVPGTPTVSYETTAAPTIGADLLYERERWDAVKDMADRLDSWIQPVPGGFKVKKIIGDNFAGNAVWAVEDKKNLLSGTRPGVSRSDRYNAVVAFNAEDETVWAAAYVTDAANPTRWDGPYGKRPAFFASPLLTQAGAQSAADTRLLSINGKARIAEVMTVTNPAIEPGDIINVLWPGTTTLEKCLVRRVEFPLVPGPMKLTVQAAPL